MRSIDPCTGRAIRSYPEFSSSKINHTLKRAHYAFKQWSGFSFKQRGSLMKKAADVLRKNKEDYARLMAMEMGKPLSQGLGEIEKCAYVCDFYAGKAEAFLSPDMVQTEARKSFIRFEPLGLVLAVMPWNFPFWQVFRCAAPTLMAGNAVVLKHASNVCGCALAIESVFKKAGFPPGLFANIFTSGEHVKDLIAHPLIAAASLTGSTGAGRSVGSHAGACLKKVVLELGGSDPYIILEDAHIEEAARICVNSRMINAGQSCIAAKRFIAVAPVFRKFEECFVTLMSQQRLGLPLDKEVDLGPMARHDLRDQLHAQVGRSLKQGAALVLGGHIPGGHGAFYPPTVLSRVAPNMVACKEELFGPVAPLLKAADEAEAVRMANDTVFGLGSAVFSRNIKRALGVAHQLEAGCCFINDFVRSDPRLPFGGIKQSGYGRELGVVGIREFVNIKTVYIK